MKWLKNWLGIPQMQQAREKILMAMLIEQMLLRSGDLNTMQADAEAWVEEGLGKIKRDYPAPYFVGIAAERLEHELKQMIAGEAASWVAEQLRQRAGG